jgi:TolB-like protein/Flp pilus assembly protein TadD
MPGKENKLFRLWEELKRRKVFRVTAMYAATAFIIMEAGDIMLPRLGLPDWTVTALIVLLITGFPIIAIISWIFDITPEGFVKTDQVNLQKKKEGSNPPNKKLVNLNNIIIVILLTAVCILLYPKIFTPEKMDRTRGDLSRANSFIAVLPFSNTRSDPDTDYLGFAIADQIIGNLVYMNHLIVRPSGSIRKYEKQLIDPIKVGNELNVEYVIIGNYLKEADMIRLNVELIDVGSNEGIWRESVEVDFNSTFELQDMVARKVVEGLNVKFSKSEMNRIEKDISNDPLAYEYYLRSIAYPFTNEGDRLAIEMLNKSIEIDSGFAPAYKQLGDRMHRFSQFGLLDGEETKRSERFYLKALSLNPDMIYALANLALIYTETDRIEQAVKLTQQILDINPNNAEAHFALGYIYRYAGMNQEAVQEMETAISLDPSNQEFRSIVITYGYVGAYEKVFDVVDKFEDKVFMTGELGFFLLRQGKREQALESFNYVIEHDAGGLYSFLAESLTSYIEGDFEAGLQVVRRIEEANILDAETWFHFAGLCAMMGDNEGAVRLLQRAVDGGFFNYPFMLKDPFFDSVRDDGEFQFVLQQANEKHLAFKKRFQGHWN